MRRFTALFTVCMAVIFFTVTTGQAPATTIVRVFLVDRYMNILIPVEHKIKLTSPEKQAEEIMNILTTPVSESSSFKQYLTQPDSRLSVKVQDETATVFLPAKAIIKIPTDRDNQKLFLYQIVNSLCSIPEINYVRFSIPGSKADDPLQIFSPNYDI